MTATGKKAAKKPTKKKPDTAKGLKSTPAPSTKTNGKKPAPATKKKPGPDYSALPPLPSVDTPVGHSSWLRWGADLIDWRRSQASYVTQIVLASTLFVTSLTILRWEQAQQCPSTPLRARYEALRQDGEAAVRELAQRQAVGAA